MKPLTHSLLLAGLALGFAGCAPMAQLQQAGTQMDESQLRNAGFELQLANTRERQDLLNTLPSDTISRIQIDDTTYYVYPDPDHCVCLYMGRESEFQRWQQLAMDRQASDQQLMINDIKSDYQNGYGPMSQWNSWNNNNPGRPNWDPH
jgi:hypothetical protein